jgi:pantetheine-phosphate adenylyltransferase
VAIVERALRIFPQVIVGVLQNTGKDSVFGADERAEMIREHYRDTPAVEVRSFSGLLVNFMQEMDATIIIRGMRAVSDFEYEFQMALMNRRLWPRTLCANVSRSGFVKRTLRQGRHARCA